MSGKKRRWPAETNLAALKTLAHTLLWFDIQPTKLSPLVVKHPFTDSGLVGIRNEDGSLSAGNLLDDPGALHSWRENVRQQINEAETAAGLLLLVTKPSAWARTARPTSPSSSWPCSAPSTLRC